MKDIIIIIFSLIIPLGKRGRGNFRPEKPDPQVIPNLKILRALRVQRNTL
jgi:hypothetical protein